MRLAPKLAGGLLVSGLAATAAYAFFFVLFAVKFLLIVTLLITLSGGGRLRQKFRVTAPQGQAYVERGSSPGTGNVNLFGEVDYDRMVPEIPPASVVTQTISLNLPLATTNEQETKGKIDADTSAFGEGAQDFVNAVFQLAGGRQSTTGKVGKGLLGGNVSVSDISAKGKIQVDTKTFTRFSGAATVKFTGDITNGPNAGGTVKGTVKVKIKPRSVER